jgi:hypothetical protein
MSRNSGFIITGIEVKVVAIDDVIESGEVDFVDFLKLDIEDHELFEFGSANINSRRDRFQLKSLSGDPELYRLILRINAT